MRKVRASATIATFQPLRIIMLLITIIKYNLLLSCLIFKQKKGQLSADLFIFTLLNTEYRTSNWYLVDALWRVNC